MSKNIVILFDGTGNQPDIGKDTNIVKIRHLLSNQNQIVHYHKGIATSRSANMLVHLFYYIWNIVQFVTGAGISHYVVTGYRDLAECYVPGDKIFLLGFSRGAYTARSLAGFIDRYGIPHIKNRFWLAFVFLLYSFSRKGLFSHFIRKNYSQDARIHFIGVFDTVGALLGVWAFRLLLLLLGVFCLNVKAGMLSAFFFVVLLIPPLTRMLATILTMHRFHNTNLSETTEHAYQALAIDETRGFFKPELWHQDNSERVQQVWFKGTHKDIGGPSDSKRDLITTHWMLENAERCGLILKPNWQEATRLMDYNMPITKNRKLLTFPRITREIPAGHAIHESAKN